jgi:hypothetical protein
MAREKIAGLHSKSWMVVWLYGRLKSNSESVYGKKDPREAMTD